jgi:hypothetical protein
MAKIAYKKSLIDTNITILALQKKKKKLMDSVSVQIYTKVIKIVCNMFHSPIKWTATIFI